MEMDSDNAGCEFQESEKSFVKNTEISEIAEFFNGKSIFITGGAGFVGSVLLETLLRCCPGIQSIYLLLRAKKGIPAEHRKSAIFQKRIFQPLKNSNPDIFAKVHVICGDMTFTDLGISSGNMEELAEHVSVVFHCAAVISFMKPLRYMIEQNVIGTENVLNFCRKLPKLEAFIHTSTAYSNCNRREIKEVVYKLTVPAKNFIEAVRSEAKDDVLLEMQKQCVPPWPNTYTFSKAMVEDLICNNASDLPVAIVRPSIIICTWKGSMPGYTEEGAGIIDVSVGIGKGFIRVLYCDEDKMVDIVPADGVVNALICSAWAIATKQLPKLLVVNFTSGEICPCTWGHFVRTLYDMNQLNPLPKMYQKPSLVMRKYQITYWLSSFVNHYAPALCIDLILLILKKKPKLTRLYRLYDTALKYLGFFLTNEWHFHCNNFKHLSKLQNTEDAKLFPVDIRDFTIDEIAEYLKVGAPFYQWEIDKKPFKDRVPLAYRRYILTSFIKWMVIFWFLILVGFVITKSIFREPVFY